MQVKKHTIQISVWLMVLSLCILTVAQFGLCPDVIKNSLNSLINQNASLLRDYVIIISGGIFTSTFVTFSIAVKEYKDARISTLEEYYNVSNDFLRNFRNLQYLFLNQPQGLIQECILEESENRQKKLNNMQIDELIKKSGGKKKKYKNVAKRAYERFSFEKKEKFKAYVWNCTSEETKRTLSDVAIKNQYLEDEYKRQMQDYYAKIDDIMKQYIQIKKCSYAMVEMVFGKIDFLISNEKIRKNFIYKYLHDRQRAVLRTISNETWHFEEYYKMDSGNLPVMLSKILKIQAELFQVEEGEIGYSVYNSYCHEIDTRLSELLSITYGKGYEKTFPDIHNYVVCSKVDMRKLNEANARISREES